MHRFYDSHVSFFSYSIACYCIIFSTNASFVKALESPQENYNCDFPESHLYKFAWAKIKQNVPDVYYLLSNIHFDKDTLDNLLDLAKNGVHNLTSWEVACKWLRQARDLWLPWLPAGTLGKVPVYIGGMFPLSVSEDAVWSRPGILQGEICFAINYVGEGEW